jgi:hypothetical protein
MQKSDFRPDVIQRDNCEPAPLRTSSRPPQGSIIVFRSDLRRIIAWAAPAIFINYSVFPNSSLSGWQPLFSFCVFHHREHELASIASTHLRMDQNAATHNLELDIVVSA